MTSSLSSTYSRVSPVATASNPAFLESARPTIMRELDKYFTSDVAKIIADYAIQGKAFMAEDWKRYYNVEVEDLELGLEFYNWWFQLDALDSSWYGLVNEGEPSELNCDTHFPPILCPETLLETAELPPPALRHRFASYVDRTDYSMETLERLVQNPKEGYPSKFPYDSEALNQIRKIKAGAACYIVARKELFARDLLTCQQRKYMELVNAATHAGYEVLPRALHLATAALVHHTVTRDRYLGDGTGMEKRCSYGRCEDTVEECNNRYLVMVGKHQPLSTEIFGDSLISGLDVSSIEELSDHSIGVVGLRKFSAHRKLNT